MSAWIEIGLSFLSVGIVFVFITLLGWTSRFLIGRFALGWIESVMIRLPLVRNIYTTAKQIIETFGKQNKAVFQKVVLVEFPRQGCYALGFVTSKTNGEIQSGSAAQLVNVFVPTTPNPTSGFLIMLPEESIRIMQMSVAEGMKLIISGGVVVPDYTPKGITTT